MYLFICYPFTLFQRAQTFDPAVIYNLPESTPTIAVLLGLLILDWKGNFHFAVPRRIEGRVVLAGVVMNTTADGPIRCWNRVA